MVYTQQLETHRNKINESLAQYQTYRTNAPLWSTIKEVLWLSTVPFMCVQESIGNFLGYAVTALVAAPPSAVIGFCTGCVIKSVNYLRGVESKSLADYTIKGIQVGCNGFYNRVTDFLFRWFAGPAFMKLIFTAPLALCVGLVPAIALSPWIYRDFAFYNSQQLEPIDRCFMVAPSMWLNAHCWEPFMNLTSDRIAQCASSTAAECKAFFQNRIAPLFTSLPIQN